jgi:hypothetical protein
MIRSAGFPPPSCAAAPRRCGPAGRSHRGDLRAGGEKPVPSPWHGRRIQAALVILAILGAATIASAGDAEALRKIASELAHLPKEDRFDLVAHLFGPSYGPGSGEKATHPTADAPPSFGSASPAPRAAPTVGVVEAQPSKRHFYNSVTPERYEPPGLLGVEEVV